MRKRRTAVDDATRVAASQAITAALLARVEFQRAREVACYLSLPQELTTEGLLAACRAQSKPVSVPVWDPANETYILARLVPDHALVDGPHGVLEPANWEAVDPYTVDVVIMPGMAFDLHGGRLGYGKGFYDRILATCRTTCTKIGICYAWQVIEGDLPLFRHDVRMDWVITEVGVIDCRIPNAI